MLLRRRLPVDDGRRPSAKRLHFLAEWHKVYIDDLISSPTLLIASAPPRLHPTVGTQYWVLTWYSFPGTKATLVVRLSRYPPASAAFLTSDFSGRRGTRLLGRLGSSRISLRPQSTLMTRLELVLRKATYARAVNAMALCAFRSAFIVKNTGVDHSGTFQRSLPSSLQLIDAGPSG